MRCPYCQHDIRVSGRFCPRCGRQVFGLPSGPQQVDGIPPQASPSAPPADTPAPRLAETGTIGKTCPYDQFPIASQDEVILCPQCGTPHHADCWRENRGCTTYGCARAPTMGPVVQAHSYGPAGSPTHRGGTYRRGAQSDTPPAMAVMAAEVDRNAANALLYALIGLPCCPVLSIIGFFLAAAVFGTLQRTGIDSPSARAKATWAVAVGVIATIVWTVVFIAAIDSNGGYY
jgi:hypothetical protein